MKKNYLTRALIFGALLLSGFVYSQTTTIDFETANDGYTSSTTAGSNFRDVFNRIDGSSQLAGAIGGNSSFIWAVEDIPNHIATRTINLDQIDVTGSVAFTFSIDMIAHHFEDWDREDELLITYSLDGGTYQNLMSVQHHVGTGSFFSGPAALDTDFDGDGECGAGTTLPALTTGTQHGCTVSSNTFETFTTLPIALSSNTTLDIRLQFNGFYANDEGIYLDNIVITETAAPIDASTTETFSGGTNAMTFGQPFAGTFNTFDFTGLTFSGFNAFLRNDSNGYAQITGSRLGEITMKLNAGGSFKLNEIVFEVANVNTSNDNITVTGYKNNSFVSGATSTFKVPGAIGAETTRDFSTNLAFGDIDEIRIEITDDGLFGGLRIESITTDIPGGSCSAPLAAANSAVFGSETSSTLNLTSFTAPPGGADGYAIYINDTNTFTVPTDGDAPVADLIWNGSGQQPVYFGTSASPNITVSDLDPDTTYYFQIYAYNDCYGIETYETTGLNTNDTTALRVLTITGLTGDNKTYDQTNAATASGSAALSGVIGSDDVILGGTPVFTFASSDPGTGITINTTGFTLSGTDAGKYTLTQPILSANICSVPKRPPSVVFGSETSSTLKLTSITAPVGGADGYAIFINDTNTFIDPTDGDEPVADLTWNGSGQQPVYFGTSASPNITVSDLDPGTTYYFQIYAYNDCFGTGRETYEKNIGGMDLVGLNTSDTTALGELTITGLTGDDKVYDGTDSATVTGTEALSGIIGSDDVSLSGTPTYSFASANVGTGITINTTGFTLSGTDAGKYTLTQPTLSADITAAELSVVGLTGDNKVYDGTTAATATGTEALSGIIGADDVILGGSGVYTFASANVGTGITINTTGFTISGTESGNYTLTQPTLSANITAAELFVVGLTGDNKVYDGTTAATATGTEALSGIIGADDVILGGSGVYTFASANVGTGITINTTGFTISGTESGNYTLTQPTLSANITAAELFVVGLTGDNKVYDGTTAATATGTEALSGIIGADDVILGGSGVYTFASANVGTGITINTTGFTISGTESGNYTLTQPTLSANITAAELFVVGLTGDNKVYDGTTAATATGTEALSGIIGADDVILGGSGVYTFASANVGTGITINTTGFTISGTESGNYTLTQPTLSANITAAELFVVGLTGDNKVYDGTTAATATGTEALSGIIGADDVILGGSGVYTFASANVGTGITINTTGFTISGTESGNYTLTQPTLSANITAAELFVVGLTGDNKVYDGTTAATATGTEVLSGIIGADDVILGGSGVYTFASANVGTGITINTTGFTISGTESGNYTLTQPTLSANITAAELFVVGLTGDNKVYDGTTAATATGTEALSGIIGADDVILGGSGVYTFASANVGTGITINTTGFTISGTESGNYTLTQPTLSANITAAELFVVGLTGDNKVYDGTTAATATGTEALSGIIGADDVILGGSGVYTFASANVGTGITINTTGFTISGTESGNYTLTQPTLSANITAAELFVVGLTGDNKVYDGTTAATATGTEALSGIIGADDVILGGSGVYTFASANVGTGITINTTGFTISGTESGNYTLTQPTLSANITAAELFVVGLTGDNKVYDGTTAATATGTEVLSGIIGADDVILGGSGVYTFASANVGTGITINTTGFTISGTESGNYTLTQPTLSANITAAELFVVGLTGDNKVYDGTTAATATGTEALSGIIGADDVILGGSGVYTFASANVGTGITINTTGFTISGTESGNYTLTQPTLSANITAAELFVVGLTGDNKVYDGTTAATATGTEALSGIIGADDVILGGSGVYTFASANVGTGITINTTGFTISGTESGNYTLTQPTLSANITAAELFVVGLTGDNKVYDGTTAATATGTEALSGIIGADDVILGGSGVYTFASANVGTGITINTTGFTISGTESGNYTLTQPTLSANITAAELFVVGLTGDNKVYDGTTAATATGTEVLSGIIGADDVILGGSGVYTFASANVGTGITINTTGFTISGTESGNYTLTQPTLSANITAAELFVVGLTGDNKVYDGTTAATATGTEALSGIIGADDVILGGSGVYTFASANVGTGITINTTGFTISGTESGNYTLTQPTLSANITAAELFVVGLTGDNKVYDGTTAATATGTEALSGIIGADDVILGGSGVYTFASANVGTGITINTTGFTISGTESGNYTLTQPTLSANITAAELFVVGLTGDNKVYDGTTAATATGTEALSGIIGADDVILGGSGVYTFASANVGTGITINTTGFTISGTESGNYTLTQPTLSANITAAELFVVGLTGDNKVYDGTTAATATGTEALSGIIGADDVILGGSGVYTFASANVGTGITINTTGFTISGTESGNYTLTQPTLSANITAAELFVVGLTGDNKVYDGTTAATATGTEALSGIIGADDVILGGSGVYTFASANVGTGITINTTGFTISGTESGNYTLTQPTLSANITAAELFVVGLTGDNKVYDGTTAATATGTEALSGIIGADDVILGGSGVYTFASANVGTGITINTTGFTISGTESGNYTLTQPTLSANITAAELFVVGLTGDNKVYDGTTAATATGTEALSGIIGADDVILGGSGVYTFASANVGTGITINTTGFTISGTESGNYTLTQPTLSANITAAELFVVGLTGDNKVYDGTTAATATGTEALSGIIGADDVILGGSGVYTFASANVGTGITINTTGFTISGTESGNYTLTQPTLSANITAAELFVVGLTGDNKVYDGTTAATATGTEALSGIIGADDVILGGSGVYTFASANVGTGITINTTGFTISGTESGNYTLTQPTLSANITAAELFVVGLTGDNKVYDGTTAATATGTEALSGIIGADDVILGGSGVYTFASANVGTGITINTTGFTISGTESGNYTLTQPTLSANITAAELFVVGLTGDNKVYDGTTAATATGTEALSGIIGADDVILGGSGVYTFASANVGTGITINTTGFTISGTESGNYTLTQPTLSADITAAELTIVGLTGDNKVYDGTTAATATGTATLSGIIGADDVILGGSPVFTFASANVGTGITINTSGYEILGPDSGNYSLTQPTLLGDIIGPDISFSTTTSSELEGTGSANITVDLSVAVPITVTVDYAVTGGSATSADYVLADGTLTFNPNTSSADILVTILDELMVEPDETIEITLSNPSALSSLGTEIVHTFTITNDDTASVTIEDVSGNEDGGDMTFTATLDNPVQGGFTVDINTTDGTAEVADNDYVAIISETLTFAGTAGEIQTFTFTPNSDVKVETDETAIINQGNLANTALTVDITDTATATITNEDTSVVTISSGDVDVDEDAGFATLVATLSNPVQGGFFINVTTADGTAVAPGDYTAFNDEPNVDFVGTAGETQNLLIPIIDDSQGELSETFTVILSSASGTTLGSFITTTDSATVTIIDNDAPVVTAVAVPADGLYGIGDNLDFTVTFTDFVTTTGTPVIPITIGATTVNAELSTPVANSLTAVFSYTIQEGEEDLDGIIVGTDIVLNGGTIIGTNSTIDAILTLNGVGSTTAVNVDGIRPIPVISSSVPDPTNAQFDITIMFDEPVTGLTLAGIDVTNGTPSNIVPNGTATEFTVTITPTTDGIVDITVLADAAFDAAGNGNVPSNTFSVEYDATRPVPTITSTEPNPTNSASFDVTISFSEPVTGFTAGDIDVANGTVTNLTGTSADYVATIEPTVNGDVIIFIPEAVVEDAATNPNDISNEFLIDYDIIPPAPPQITHISDYTCPGDVSQTGDNTLEISGAAERGSTVEVFVDGISIGTTVTDANTGFWTFDYTGTVLADGTYNFTAQATDIATNTGGLSLSFTITVNTVDSDGDGNPDFCDDDDNGNGAADVEEDCDGDGIVDSQDTDNSSCRQPILQTRSYGFSPNGDGVNDGWVIENITAFPNNVVQVYSRSGKLVFSQRNYQNDWQAVSNQLSGNTLGRRLPVGPYIYLIDLGDGSAPIRGWLYINY